jgi:hypothetical protein
MTIQAIDAGLYHDVAGFYARIARNQPKWWGKVKVELIAYIQICCYSILISVFLCQQLQVEDYDLSYAGCSFQVILNQTMYALGFDWKYADEWPTLTMEGFQEKLIITKRWSSDLTASRSPLTVVSRPCARTFEARKSALLNALLYVNNICGYKIGDLHFAEYILRCSQTWWWSTCVFINLVSNWTLGLDI